MNSIVKFAIPFLTLGAIGVYMTREIRHASPGPLSAVHAQVRELDGDAGCEICHGDGSRLGLAKACLRCHEGIANDRSQHSGVHGRHVRDRLDECARCHREHAGASFSPTNERSFLLAGIADWKHFDHAGLDFQLSGKHAALQCKACHRHADTKVLVPGTHRFAGLTQECTSCHADPHEDQLGSDCRSCHGEERPFREVAAFMHDARFPLRHGHARLECRSCHAPGTRSSLEVLTDLPAKPPVRACAECHADPHAPNAQDQKPPLLAETGDCARCHDTRAFKGKVFGVAEHAAIGVELVGAHAQAACAGCHSGARAGKLTRKRGFLDACATCHASPHKESFAADGCVQCHDGGSPGFAVVHSEPTRAAHAAIGFALTEPHAQVACTGCHEATARPYAERYPGRQPGECATCHGDPHRGQFTKGPFALGGCLQCHESKHFKPSIFTPAMHASCRFKLEGAHAATACNACHKPLPAEGKLPGVPDFAPAAQACSDCHADAHAGAFGTASCSSCHGVTAFRPPVGAFDHAKWTGYVLRGKHATTACASCHPRLPAPDENGRRFERARTQCAECHADPHAGQFVRGTTTDCARCHLETGSFQDLRFDHGRDSRFHLDAAHVRLACAACHKTYDLPGLGRVVRYRPLGTECADCHDARRGSGK